MKEKGNKGNYKVCNEDWDRAVVSIFGCTCESAKICVVFFFFGGGG